LVSTFDAPWGDSDSKKNLQVKRYGVLQMNSIGSSLTTKKVDILSAVICASFGVFIGYDVGGMDIRKNDSDVTVTE
jgi:hypothetical protein